MQIVNNATAAHQLGTVAVSSVSPEMSFFPVLWVFLTIPIHLLATTTMKLRARIFSDQNATPLDEHHSTSYWSRLKTVLVQGIASEMQLSSSQPQATLVDRPESMPFQFFSWITSTAIVLSLVFGTLTLSGTLFVSPKDALGVFGRYFASGLVARAILTVCSSSIVRNDEC
jgi:hypothetical protein